MNHKQILKLGANALDADGGDLRLMHLTHVWQENANIPLWKQSLGLALVANATSQTHMEITIMCLANAELPRKRTECQPHAGKEDIHEHQQFCQMTSRQAQHRRSYQMEPTLVLAMRKDWNLLRAPEDILQQN